MYSYSKPYTKTQQRRETPSKSLMRRQQRKRAALRRMEEMDKEYADKIARIVDDVYLEMVNLTPEEWAALDEIYPRHMETPFE